MAALASCTNILSPGTLNTCLYFFLISLVTSMTGLLSAPLGLLTIDLRACGVCVCVCEREREREREMRGERGKEVEKVRAEGF